MANVEYSAIPQPWPEWNVSYNNAEEFVVQATTERHAIAAGLEFLGITAPVHPVRAWPKPKQEQT